MQPAHFFHQISSRPQHKVICITQNNFSPGRFHRFRQHGLDCAAGSDRHKRRRVDVYKRQPQNIVSTIEHIMSVFYILGIDNALVKVNNPEVPILDGSGREFLRILQSAELAVQNAPRRILKVSREVRFEDGKGASITLLPAETLDVYKRQPHNFLCMTVSYAQSV